MPHEIDDPLSQIESVVSNFNTFSGDTLDFKKTLYRRTYMSAHILFYLLIELGKRDTMRCLPSILSLFRNEFTGTRMRILFIIWH